LHTYHEVSGTLFTALIWLQLVNKRETETAVNAVTIPQRFICSASSQHV